MMTREQLVALSRRLRDRRVLSVYLSRRVDNPAERHAWQAQLANQWRDWERSIAQRSATELEEFERARAAIEREMTGVDFDPLHSSGIVIFATADGVEHRDVLFFHVPVIVLWRNGISVAPYVRALKEDRRVVLAVVDGGQARVLEYRYGTLRQLTALAVQPHLEPPQHMGAPATRMHRGVHGATGKDTAQHRWAAATDHLVHELREELIRQTGPGDWVIIGGRADVARHIRALLPPALEARCALTVAISAKAWQFQLAIEARGGASRLRNAADHRALTSLEALGDNGPGARGAEKTFRALYNLTVAALYISEGYLALHPDDAEDAMRRALEQGAEVETVTGTAALKLDRMGGIAARLRYAVPGQAPRSSSAEQVAAVV